MMKMFHYNPQLFFTLWLFYALLQGGSSLALPVNPTVKPVAGTEGGSSLPGHEEPAVNEDTLAESPPVMEIRNLPEEAVFVDTDRDIYFAGDHLFFKAYLTAEGQNANPLQSKVLYLSLGNEAGNQIYRLELELDGQTTHGSIRLADTLQTAAYRLLAWTNNMLISETPPFARQLAVVNRFDPEIRSFIINSIQMADKGEPGLYGGDSSKPEYSSETANESIVLLANKPSYGLRERIRLSIDTGMDFPGKASASLSVSREETLLLNSPRIATAFVGSGEMDGAIPGHTRLRRWNHQPEMLILPENLGPVISGRVIDNGTGRPLMDAVVFLSAMDSISNLKYSRTHADGSFFFLLEDYHQGKTLYISVFEAGESRESLRIELREKFPAMPFSPWKMAMHPAIHAYIEELLLVRRARRAYQTEGFGIVYEDVEASLPPPPLLYGKPTHRIQTRDYLPMDNLAEMSIEIVPNLRLRQQGDSYTARMIDSRSSSFFPEPPVFFLNGVWLPVIDEIAGLSSEEITRIEVLSRPWAFGSLQFSGIVGIFTMKHQIPSHPTTRIIQGSPHQTKVRFDPDPHAGRTRSNIPDYREALYWEPSISLQRGHSVELEFTSSDLPGSYVISMEGMTECGIPFSKTTTITVE
jgi:hypothetical protein